MRRAPDSVLVICDGGVGALVACMLPDNPEGVIAWVPPPGTPSFDQPDAPTGPWHRRAVEEQADLLGLRGVQIAPAVNWPGPGLGAGAPVDRPTGLSPSALLLLGVEEAARFGCGTLVWPVFCGSDLDAMTDAAERARLISRLASLGGSGSSGSSQGAGAVRVETPLADLSVDQVAQMALDLDAPTHTCWWNHPDEGGPSWLTEARLSWESALRTPAQSCGFAWPGRVAAAGGGGGAGVTLPHSRSR